MILHLCKGKLTINRAETSLPDTSVSREERAFKKPKERERPVGSSSTAGDREEQAWEEDMEEVEETNKKD
jgi:hypothetical protein